MLGFAHPSRSCGYTVCKQSPGAKTRKKSPTQTTALANRKTGRQRDTRQTASVYFAGRFIWHDVG